MWFTRSRRLLARIIGESGSWINLIGELGVEFDSLEAIFEFQSSWEQSIRENEQKEIATLQNEINVLKDQIEERKFDYDFAKEQRRVLLRQELESISVQLNQLEDELEQVNIVKRFFLLFRKRKLQNRFNVLDTNFSHELVKPLRKQYEGIIDLQITYDHYVKDFDFIIKKRTSPFRNRIHRIVKSLEEHKSLLIGAIGEEKAIAELQKLPDSYTVINDFQLEFSPPLYNRQEKDHIFSVQVDHLVVGPTGVFLIETKNWSKESIRNLSLFSPVKQIRRASYAIFVMLNSPSSKVRYIFSHHWGERKIPVKNIVLMIGSKPTEEFQYVKVLTRERIRGYITYFDEVFSDEEVEGISLALSY